MSQGYQAVKMLILASEMAILILVSTRHHLQMQTTFAKNFDQELPTPIQVDLLAKYLSGYDKTEKEYILHGFSKGFTVFSAISDTQVQCRNLQSALLRPGIVAEKIQTELAAGRFAGPFVHPPLPKFHVSPLGLCPKKEPNKLRMIHHLPYPKGGSVNDFISPEYSSVQYTRIQDAISVCHKNVSI